MQERERLLLSQMQKEQVQMIWNQRIVMLKTQVMDESDLGCFWNSGGCCVGWAKVDQQMEDLRSDLILAHNSQGCQNLLNMILITMTFVQLSPSLQHFVEWILSFLD